MRQFFSRRPDPLYNGEAIVFKNPSLVHSGKCAASVHRPTSTIISSVGKWGVGLSKKGRQRGRGETRHVCRGDMNRTGSVNKRWKEGYVRLVDKGASTTYIEVRRKGCG